LQKHELFSQECTSAGPHLATFEIHMLAISKALKQFKSLKILWSGRFADER